MRRNLRLDWRALALLGALLSVIIDWPGLVFALPALSPSAATNRPIENNSAKKAVLVQQQQQQQQPQKQNYTYFYKNISYNNNINDNSDVFNKQYNISASEISTNLALSESGNKLKNNATITSTNYSKSTGVAFINQLRTFWNQTFAINQTKLGAVMEKAELAAIQTTPTADVTAEVLTDTTTFVSTEILTPTRLAPDTNNNNNITAFMFSSSRNLHIAILSRTERSIRRAKGIVDHDHRRDEDDVENVYKNYDADDIVDVDDGLTLIQLQQQKLQQQQQQKQHKQEQWEHREQHYFNNAGLVRISPDGTQNTIGVSKSKRLNNFKNINNSNKSHQYQQQQQQQLHRRNLHQQQQQQQQFTNKNNLDRNERSTVSHLSGPSRKIQLYIKNRFIQLLPEGSVNGTQDDQSEYTILQRSTVDVGRIKIQGVATCLYLCMDACGAAYGSKDFTDDCVFNENMEQHNYNTYSSTYNSNGRRIYYLALNRHGEPRRLQIPPSRSLGKLATYTNAITETVSQERVDQLIAKNFGANRIKHGIRQLCDTGKPLIELIDSKNFKARPKCNPNSSLNSNSNSQISSNSSLSGMNATSGTSSVRQSKNFNGQSQNIVPAANDRARNGSTSSISIDNARAREQSPEQQQQQPVVAAVSGGASSQSSISNSSQKHGHISNRNHSSTNSDSHLGDVGASLGAYRHNQKKKRKQQRPQALRRRGGANGVGSGGKKCKQMPQQTAEANAPMPNCATNKRGGGKKKQTKKTNNNPIKKKTKEHTLDDNRAASQEPAQSQTQVGGSNQRCGGKKQNGSGGKNKNCGDNGSGSKKRGKNGTIGNGAKRPKQMKNKSKVITKTSTTTTMPTSTTATLFTADTTQSWQTTTSTYSGYDTRAENTSDRVEREQRNVRYPNSMEAPQNSGDNDSDVEGDFIDADGEGNAPDTSSQESTEESESYEDGAGEHAPPLTAGADDSIYYDQIDL